MKIRLLTLIKICVDTTEQPTQKAFSRLNTEGYHPKSNHPKSPSNPSNQSDDLRPNPYPFPHENIHKKV
jgi:hypothetical protein